MMFSLVYYYCTEYTIIGKMHKFRIKFLILKFYTYLITTNYSSPKERILEEVEILFNLSQLCYKIEGIQDM